MAVPEEPHDLFSDVLFAVLEEGGHVEEGSGIDNRCEQEGGREMNEG